MKFERESYRKLYVAESAEHRLLPLAVRGVRDYLIRHPSEDGTLLPSSKDPVGDLARFLGALPSERKLVSQALTDLQRVGFLKLEPDGRLWMPKFEEAQAARSAGATRQQRYRDNKKRQRDDEGDDGCNASGDATGNVTRDVTSNRPNRRDETQQTQSGAVPIASTDRETTCPADIVQRLLAAGVFTEMGKRLGISAAALQLEAEKTAGYWLAGKGMGLKRRNWPGIFRQRLLDRAARGEIVDEIADDEGPPPEIRAKIANLREGIGG